MSGKGPQRQSRDTKGLSRAVGPNDLPLINSTIGQDLRDYAASLPDQLALVDAPAGVEFSASALDEAVSQVADSLSVLGVVRGDRVAVWSTNRYEWILVQLASARIGAVIVCINPAYELEDLSYVLSHSQSKVLFYCERVSKRELAPILDQVRPRLESMQADVCFDDDSWQAFLALGQRSSVDRDWDSVLPSDASCIMYTSGTTGKPKAAMQNQHSLLNNGFLVAEALHLTSADRLCLPAPLFHVLGCMMGVLGALSHRSAVVLTGPKFQADLVLDAVEKYGCTVLYGVPTMFLAELDEGNRNPRNLMTLRTGIVAGAACPLPVIDAILHKMDMSSVITTYGMTETGVTSITRFVGEAYEAKQETIESVMPHVEIEIRDTADGSVVPLGAIGEIHARGYSVMDGYWGDHDATAATVSPDGWLRTGDLGVLGTDGQLEIVGREKDMIIRGGENIYPAEIESFLATHPDVEEAYVVGVPDARLGEEVAAFVRLRAGAQVTDQDLISYSERKIARYKIPRLWRIVESFPQTATGKIQKFRLREEASKEFSI